VIWEPFVLALVLGLIVSAGLYFAYLWPTVEPQEDEVSVAPTAPASHDKPVSPASDSAPEPAPEPATPEPKAAEP
jgi:hypothetical protein